MKGRLAKGLPEQVAALSYDLRLGSDVTSSERSLLAILVKVVFPYTSLSYFSVSFLITFTTVRNILIHLLIYVFTARLLTLGYNLQEDRNFDGFAECCLPSVLREFCLSQSRCSVNIVEFKWK